MTMCGRIRVFLLLAALAFSAAAAQGGAGGSGQAGPAGADAAQAIDSTRVAPVVVDGVVLFQVRGTAGYPAEKRAGEIADRIVATARDERIPVDAIKVREHALGSEIVAGDERILVVLDEDARLESIGDRRVVADVYRQLIARAITNYRSDREPRARLVAAAYGLGAFAVLAAVLYGLRRLYRYLDVMLQRRYRRRVEDLQIKGFKVLHTEHVWNALRTAIGAIHFLVGLTAVYLALNFALAQFPLTRGFASSLFHLIVAPLVTMGHGLVAEIPNLVFLAILTLVTRYVLKTLKLFFVAVEAGTVKLSGFDAEWSAPTYKIVRILVIAFAVVVAYPYIPGSGSEAFKGVSIFLGVIFSLGSSSIIANTIAGYSMTYRRAFRVGDRIRIGDIVGDVTEVRLQVTHVRTPKNEEVVIPNSVILGGSVINYSTLARTDGLILHTTVGIGYETPWRQVEAMLVEAAGRTPSLLRSPAPFVLQTALGDFAITYELNAYCDRPAEMNRIYTELHRNILDVFNEFGVAIMTPAYEGDPEQPKLVPKDQWYAAPARPPEKAQGGA
jgi:small-conductance mechanosensitive channel